MYRDVNELNEIYVRLRREPGNAAAIGKRAAGACWPNTLMPAGLRY